MQNEHNNFKINNFPQNLTIMRKYAHSNFRSEIMALINKFISYSPIFSKTNLLNGL